MGQQRKDSTVEADARAKQRMTRQLMRECRAGGTRLSRKSQRVLRQIAGAA